MVQINVLKYFKGRQSNVAYVKLKIIRGGGTGDKGTKVLRETFYSLTTYFNTQENLNIT
jgi:hypothetical protein